MNVQPSLLQKRMTTIKEKRQLKSGPNNLIPALNQRILIVRDVYLTVKSYLAIQEYAK